MRLSEQEAADEVASWENRDGDVAHVPHHEEGVEILLLDGPDAEVHLIERRGENEHDRECDQNDRELERDEEVAELAGKVVHGLAPAGRMVLRKSAKAACSRAMSGAGPESLKNQVASPKARWRRARVEARWRKCWRGQRRWRCRPL